METTTHSALTDHLNTVEGLPLPGQSREEVSADAEFDYFNVGWESYRDWHEARHDELVEWVCAQRDPHGLWG